MCKIGDVLLIYKFGPSIIIPIFTKKGRQEKRDMVK